MVIPRATTTLTLLVPESAGHLQERELRREVAFAHSSERLGESGTFGRRSYREILLTRDVKQALMQINEEKDAFMRDGIPCVWLLR